MKFDVYTLPSGSATRGSRTVAEADGWWVRFGDELLVYSSNAKWDDVSRRMVSAGGRSLGDAPGDVTKGKMHLVVQKGRTFQLEHPDARVIFDRGRYLVVEVEKAAARRMDHGDTPCFHIEPLKENSVVYETVDTPAAAAHDAQIESVLSEVNQAAFEAALTQFVSYPTRLSTSPSFDEAADWAIGRLEIMGYHVNSPTVTWEASNTSRNVIASRRGVGTGTRDHILIVAHLDSINQPDGPSAPAPGADDNASGSAGLMTMAQALAAFQVRHDLTFILFGGEEQGLHGSQQYVADLSADERARIRAVINMDMIGSVNTPAPTVLLEGAALSQSMIDALASAAATYTGLAVQTSLNPFASDHVPFINAGIPAVLTIEGADSANDAIHTAADTIDKVDAGFATEILRMNTAFVAGLAEVHVPVVEDCGCGHDVTADSRQVLATHYRNLSAQYARLHARGWMQPQDYSAWQALNQVQHVMAEGITEFAEAR